MREKPSSFEAFRGSQPAETELSQEDRDALREQYGVQNVTLDKILKAGVKPENLDDVLEVRAAISDITNAFPGGEDFYNQPSVDAAIKLFALAYQPELDYLDEGMLNELIAQAQDRAGTISADLQRGKSTAARYAGRFTRAVDEIIQQHERGR